MKLFKFFAATLAVLGTSAFTSCSSDEPGGSNNEATVQADQYIRVNISNPTELGTRDGSAENYDQGTATERKIENIAFYFFNDDGTPFKMENNSINGTLVPSNLVRPNMDLKPDGGTLATTLLLGKSVDNGWKGFVPNRMIAVANIGKTNAESDGIYNSLANKTIEDLQAYLINKKGGTTNPGNGYFAMSTSSYWDEEGNRMINWTEIKEDFVHKTPEEAMNKPVTLYIERLSAKVTVSLDPAAGKGEGDRFVVASRLMVDPDGVAREKKFYAKLLGWDLNSTISKAHLVKQIDMSKNPYSTFAQWNVPTSFRSFWATSPALGGEVSLKTDFNWHSLGNKFGGQADYCLENTSQYEGFKTQSAKSKATKVLLKARIENEEGVAQDMISWSGTLFTVADFKQLVASYCAGEGDAGDANLVEFKRDDKHNMYVVSTYYDGQKIDWFDNVRYWEDGICYYIVNIRHTVNKDGNNIYGVVRNHTYRVSINSIAGLGTPGGPGDHDQPENPDPNSESYVAATVEILPWHVVDFSVDVES